MEEILKTLLGLVNDWGYLGIFVLMTMESSLMPLSSKLIIVPAGYLAEQGQMDIYLVVLFGSLGGITGASINYSLARFIGRPFIHKWAMKKAEKSRFWAYNVKKILKAEEFFENNSKSALVLGNLVSGLRQFIAIPAGFVKMPFSKFLVFSACGIVLWVTILALIGYLVGRSQELWTEYYLFAALLLVLLVLAFILYKIFKKNESN